MSQAIASVNSVCFNIEKSNPPQLTVHAIGKVSSSGWTNSVLIPRIYFAQPADGIQDFDFLADAPVGNALWVICPIAGDATVVLEKWVKGVRINSATGNISVNLNDISCSVPYGALSSHVLLSANGNLDYFSDPGDNTHGGQGVPPDMPKGQGGR